jgi:putative lipoic acid-binding regulatory protein
MPMQMQKLKTLLENETYPHRYMHKFIGAKTSDFLAGVESLTRAFPSAKVSTRETPGKGGQVYVAYTFEFEADSADEIIRLIRATHSIKDLKVVL